MTFEELTQRLHAVMDDFGVSHRHDLRFLSQIAWVFDITVNFKLVERDEGAPCEPDVVPDYCGWPENPEKDHD